MKRRNFIQNLVFTSTGLFTLDKFLATDSFSQKEEKIVLWIIKTKSQNGLFAHALDEFFYSKVNKNKIK